MADTLATHLEFVTDHQLMTINLELLQVLTTGDMARMVELLSREDVQDHAAGEGQVQPPQTDGQVEIAISVHGAAPAAARPGTSCLLGVTSNGNTALHLAASRGNAGLVRLICGRAPSLVATRNRSHDTPLHCAAKAGHRGAAALLLSAMLAGGDEEKAAMMARNQTGATALYEAVRHGHAGVVALLMTEAPVLASVTTDDGVSPLYLAAMAGMAGTVRDLLRPSPDGTPSPASFAGRNGRTALHVAAASSAEMVQDILAWEPQGRALLTTVDSSGRSPLHFAVQYDKLDVVEHVLKVEASLARVSDKDGSFPLHTAATVGSTRIIELLINKCPDYYELVDDKGRNFLHCAVEHKQAMVVQYICQNDRFAMLLNATDFEGNTPLHLAAMNGHPRIVILLLRTMNVQMNIVNKDGLTASDLAYSALPSRQLWYFLDPNFEVRCCLRWAGAGHTLDANHKDEEPSKAEDDLTRTGTIASVLIASAAFGAAFSVTTAGGEGQPRAGAGSPAPAGRFALGAFVASDAMAFLCSIVATCFLMYGGAGEIPRRHRRLYNLLAFALVPMGAQHMIAAFAFGFHLHVLAAAAPGAAAASLGRRWLVVSVYAASFASILFCFPSIWDPMHPGLGKAVWRRAGWRGVVTDMSGHPLMMFPLRPGLVRATPTWQQRWRSQTGWRGVLAIANVYGRRRPLSATRFLDRFSTSFLFERLRRLIALLISASLVVGATLIVVFHN